MKEIKELKKMEIYSMTDKHMKRCVTSPITRELQIKTTVRYHCTPIRTANSFWFLLIIILLHILLI